MNNIRAGAKIPLFVLVPPNFDEPEVTAMIFTLAPFAVIEDSIVLSATDEIPMIFVNEDTVMPEKPIVHVIYSVAETGQPTYVAQDRFGLERVPLAFGEELVGIVNDREMIIAEILN